MRNIYDIITEQKALIDVKFASYDLEYTNNYFISNQNTYYLQEGFGESIKNFVKKIIDFIKSIISKIRDLVRKFLDFFRKTKSNNLEDELNAKIAAANASGGGGGGSSSVNNTPPSNAKPEGNKTTIKPDNNANKKETKEPVDPMVGKGTKLSELKDVLATSTLQVRTKKFGPLKVRDEFVGDLADAFSESVDEATDEVEKYHNKVNFSKLMLNNLFGEKEGSLIEYAKKAMYDSDEEETITVLKMSSTIYEYITNTYSFVDVVKKTEAESIGELNVLIRDLENYSKTCDNEEARKDLEIMADYSKEASSIMGNLFNCVIQSTMRAYQLSATIARAATEKYCKQNLHRD